MFDGFVDQPVLALAILRRLEQVKLPAPVCAQDAGVVVGHDHLLILAARSLGHTVGPGGVEDVKILVQLRDEGAVVVGHHDPPPAFDQRIMEPDVVRPGERYLIALGVEVGRVAVEEGVVPVVLGDELLEVLVLDHHVLQPPGALPDQMEEAADVAGAAREGLGAAAEAVPHQLEVVRRTAQIALWGALQRQAADGLLLGRFQVDLCQLQLLLEIAVGELLLGEESVKHVEIVPRIQRQEAQLPEQGHGALLHAAEQVGEVAVEIIVDLHAAPAQGAAKGDSAAAAEHVHEPRVAGRGQPVEKPQQLPFAAHPGDEAFQRLSPPSSSRTALTRFRLSAKSSPASSLLLSPPNPPNGWASAGAPMGASAGASSQSIGP